MDITKENVKIIWDDDLEKLIKDECEISYSYYLLHNLSYIRFSHINNYINLPVMILSSLTGASSMGSSAIFNNVYISSIVIGLVILLLNSLQAINTYFKFSQLSEAHRIASISFQKVSRYLEIELSLPRKQRSDPKIILKVLKNEIDRLMETSPLIEQVIIDKYNKKYKDERASKPAIVNGLKIICINDEDNKSINSNQKNESFQISENKTPSKENINIVIDST
jgi:hypothetical protein